mmetsp:Transcript_8404/g.16417  ORF Transcript_8404/g.16417 Transcript_8404/m.16417 type:complete len:107 (+) Transcript_8404:55-375(+)
MARAASQLALLLLASMLLGARSFLSPAAGRLFTSPLSIGSRRSSSAVQALSAQVQSALPEADSFIKLHNAKLRPVDASGSAGEPEIQGRSLYSASPAVIFATRRPG